VSELVVIVPSRGRPEAAAALARVFAETCTADSRLVFAVDHDDPELDGYSALISNGPVDLCIGNNSSMVSALNYAAALATYTPPRPYVRRPGHHNDNPSGPLPFAVGFMGDDHRPRTVGWDQAYLDVLRELGTGIVYGNDLYQGEKLPTQCAMTADIVRALGFMAPPMLRHMYVDNFWRDLGTAAGCIRYLPDVVVEHMHPAAGKAAVDPGYERVNDPGVFAVDARAYASYRASGMPADVAKVRELREAGGISGQRGETLATLAEHWAEPEAQRLTAFDHLRQGPVMPGSTPAGPRPEGHEWRLFPEGTVPEYTRPDWYAGREAAPHLEQVGHRDRLLQTAGFVAQAAFSLRVDTVVDLGSGDGGLLSLLGPSLTAWGYDLTPANVEAAKERGVDVRYGDVVDGDIEWGQVAVCTEMLEHLIDPHAFVRRIAGHVQALVCSSPHDEWAGHAYEFHTWAWDLVGYRALLEQGGFKVLRQRKVHGFQVVLAVRS
jgi:hypothetical protein